MFQGKGKSVRNDDKFFGLPTDVDSRTLRNHVTPPGIRESDKADLSELIFDAPSIPGKSDVTGDQEDSMAHLSESFLHLAVATRQEQNGDERRRDLKWGATYRNALRSVKSEEDLADMLHHTRQVEHSRIRSLVADQKAILHRYLWPDHVVEAWCYRGPIYVISTNALKHYISLLEHLLRVAPVLGWDAAKQESDYHVRKWEVTRGNANSRLVVVLSLYMYLRDGAHQEWLFPKLERSKLISLYQTMQG